MHGMGGGAWIPSCFVVIVGCGSDDAICCVRFANKIPYLRHFGGGGLGMPPLRRLVARPLARGCWFNDHRPKAQSVFYRMFVFRVLACRSVYKSH